MKYMNMNSATDPDAITGRGRVFRQACIHSCNGIVARMSKIKEVLLAEARNRFNVEEHLLRLAVNEAEALAWQTSYPHLVFPALAAEKVQGVAEWNRHQLWLAGDFAR